MVFNLNQPMIKYRCNSTLIGYSATIRCLLLELISRFFGSGIKIFNSSL